MRYQMRFIFFFFNDTATTEIYTLSLHDALPISQRLQPNELAQLRSGDHYRNCDHPGGRPGQIPTEEGRFLRTRARSEEHTSELQSQSNLVCRLLLEKKKLTDHLLIDIDTELAYS